MPFRNAKTEKIVMDGQGCFLHMEKGAFVVSKGKETLQRFTLFEKLLGEVQMRSQNCVSVGALCSLAWWNVDCLFLTAKGRPVAMLQSFDDSSHVETRVQQVEALKDGRGLKIAEKIITSKILGQNKLLRKYGRKTLDLPLGEADGSIEAVRKRFMGIESRMARHYFAEVFSLIPEGIRPSNRVGFKSFSGVDNLFNLGYEMLSWKVHKALVSAKLEAFLGFLHATQTGKASLTCDFMELYRFLIDDFVVEFCRALKKSDFVLKQEVLSKGRIGKRQYLNDEKTRGFMKRLDAYFDKVFEIPRMRYGSKQTLETLINEEALLLAAFLRGEKKEWNPRIPDLPNSSP